MRLLLAVSLCAPFVCLLVLLAYPVKAERHDVITIPPIKCGPQCVVETYKFDDEQEAKEFAEKHKVKYYEYPNNKGAYFVEVHMTESEANLL